VKNGLTDSQTHVNARMLNAFTAYLGGGGIQRNVFRCLLKQTHNYTAKSLESSHKCLNI